MKIADMTATSGNCWIPLIVPGVCGTCVFLVLLLPGRGFAETSADAGESVFSPAQATLIAPAALIAPTATIGTINIANGSIFDIDNPQEDKMLFRLANRLHIKTRPGVIEQQLLFDTGDLFSSRELQESERILRGNRYIQDATIESVRNANGTVDINVKTTDVWTLMPRISISRSGGENNAGIGVKETNLLGTGMAVEALYKSNVDRNSTIIKFADSHLGDSWYSLDATYVNSSDGHTYLLGLGKPFYSLDSRSAQGMSYLDGDQIDSLYDRGEIMAQYRNQARSYEMFKGWSGGLRDGWTRRYTTGLAYDDRRFSAIDDDTLPVSVIPEDRLLIYPFVAFEFVQDRFEKTENLNQINRTEDLYLGTRFGARLGVPRTSFGSDRNAWLINAGAQTGFGSSRTSSLILAGNFATRVEDAGPQNLTLGVSASYYHRQSDKRLFYAGLSGTFGHNLDVDNPLLLGGDNGLRGYPLRYQTGDKSALITLEQRFFTDWYPFRLFRVGGAVFFDAGRVWGDSPISDRNNGILKDIGFGLRLGNPRSGQGRVAHIDLAFPLDGNSSIKDVQLLIQTRKSF